MSKAIWKYPVPREREFTLDMPVDRVLLTVDHDALGELSMWWEVVPDSEREDVHFIARMTGEEVSDEESYKQWYLGTFLDSGFVLHLHEKWGDSDD